MASPSPLEKKLENTLDKDSSLPLKFEDWVEEDKIDEHPADKSVPNLSAEAVQPASNDPQYRQAQVVQEVSDQTVNSSSNQIDIHVSADKEQLETLLSGGWHTPHNVPYYPQFAQEVENRRKSPINPDRYVLPKILVPSVRQDAFCDALENQTSGPGDLLRCITDGEFDDLLLQMYPNIEDAQNDTAPAFDPFASMQFGASFMQQENQSPHTQCMQGLNSSRKDLNNDVIRNQRPGFSSHPNSRANSTTVTANFQVELRGGINQNHAVDNEKFILACRNHIQSKASGSCSSPQDLSYALANGSLISDEVKEWLDYNIIKARKAADLTAHTRLPGAIIIQPEVADYDPLNSNLNPEQEESDASQCLRDSKTLFSGIERDGSSWDEEFAAPLPPTCQSNTERNNDHPFFITWEEFEAELERFDFDKEETIQANKEKISNPSAELVKGDPLNRSDVSVDNHSANKAKACQEKATLAGGELLLTSRGALHNVPTDPDRVSTLGRPAVDPSYPVGSANSFKTSDDDLSNPMDLDTDDEISLIQTSPVRHPNITPKRVSKPLKSTYVKSALKEKSTKNIFAAVESRNEQKGGHYSDSCKAGSSWNWGETSHPAIAPPIHAPPAPTHHQRHPSIDVGLGSPVPCQSSAISSSFPPSPHPRRHSSLAQSPTSPTPPLSQISPQFCPVSPTVHQFPQALSGGNLMGPVAVANHFPLRGRGQGIQAGSGGRHGPVKFLQGYSTRGGYRSMRHVENPQINPTMVPLASPTMGNQLSPVSQYRVPMTRPELRQGNYSQDVSPTPHTGVNRGDNYLQKPSVFNQPINFPMNEKLVGKQPHARKQSENLQPSIDSTPLKINFPHSYSSQVTSRETLTITFKDHEVRQAAVKILEEAAQRTDGRFTIAEDFGLNTTKIVVSGPAGKNMRGFVRKYVPYGKIDIAMAF